MSDATPPPPPFQPEPTQPAAEQLVFGGPTAPPPSAPPRRSRKGWFVGGGAAVVLVAGGGAAAWAAMSFFSTGAQPAETLPDSTIAYASIDLDPAGGQKIAALKFAHKFPAFEEETGIDVDDDVREWIFDKVKDETGCELDWSSDVEPWLGSRAAIAAVGTDEPKPVVVVQTKDAGKADAGIAALLKCGEEDGSDDVGYVVEGDWIVFAETKDIAEQVVADAKKGSLADDPDYQRWTGEAGDPGIVSGYVAPALGPLLAKQLDKVGDELGSLPSELGSALPGGSATAPSFDPSEFCTDDMLSEDFTYDDCTQAFGGDTGMPDYYSGDSDFGTDDSTDPLLGALASCGGAADSAQLDQARSKLADFGGAATTLRFSDGGLEQVFVGDAGVKGSTPESASIGTLPKDVGAAIGFSLGSGWVDGIIDQIKATCGDDFDPSTVFDQLSEMTGLDLPGDIEKLLGDSVSLAVGPGLDPEVIANSASLDGLPIAIKLHGDADEISSVIDKLKTAFGDAAPQGLLDTEQGDDSVVLGPDPDFRKQVAADGGLGSERAFTEVVPQGDKATFVFYVNVNQLDDVVEQLASGDKEVEDNLDPLASIGFSAWVDDGVSHALVKLSTD